MAGRLIPDWKLPVFTVIGGALGYLYYWKVGCVSGVCSITSNPYASVVYGGVLGLLISGLFPRIRRKNKKAAAENKDA